MAGKREALSSGIDNLIGGKKKVEDKGEIAENPEIFTGKKVGTSIMMDEGLRNTLRHYCIDNNISMGILVEWALVDFWKQNIKDK